MKKGLLGFLAILSLIVLMSCKTTKYRVQFKDEEVLISQKSYNPDSLIIEPEGVVKEGYNLLGWFTNIEDLTTKWDFFNDTIKDDMVLHTIWEIDLGYIEVTNLEFNNNLLTWDEILDASYTISFLNHSYVLDNSEYSLVEHLDTIKNEGVVEFTIIPNKEGFDSVSSEFKIRYKEASEVEVIKQDFENVSKQGYAEGEVVTNNITYLLSNTLIGTSTSDLKNDSKAARVYTDGLVEIKEDVVNFSSLSFYYGTYSSNNDSSIDLEYSLDRGNTWIFIKSFNAVKELKLESISYSDITNLKDSDSLRFRFKKDSIEGRINIDGIIINTKIHEGFELVVSKSEYGNYYDSIEGLEGEELVDELHFLLKTSVTKGITYADIKIILAESDVYLDDPSKVIGIYNRELYDAKWGSTLVWHREHVWPNSKLGMDRVTESGINQGSDPHNLRAINPGTNSSRSNRYYSLRKDPLSTIGHTTEKDMYYPGNLDVGDVSRILMYMAVRYMDIGLKLTDSNNLLTKGNYTPDTAYMGLLSLLNNWHEIDPVDEFEINRNEVIYSYQGNRNPFIDKPELFNLVFEYFMLQDGQLLINMDLTINVSLNYSEFKKHNNLYNSIYVV